MDSNTLDSKDEPKSIKRKNPFNTLNRKEEKERRQKKKCRIIVRNISYRASEKDLQKYFSQWGVVEELNLLKRADGKLVGCAFVQYQQINNASKAILKGNNQLFLGRPLYIDWAVGKDEYKSKAKECSGSVEKKIKIELENLDIEVNEAKNEFEKSKEGCIKSESDSSNSGSENEISEASDNDETDSKHEEILDKSKLNISKVKGEKHLSNDVQEGCTVFVKNVPFDAEDADLRKVCRKFGPLYYAIVNREPISGHSKGTAFVKFKRKDSAELCLQSSDEFKLMDQILEPFPALSKEEIRNQEQNKMKKGQSTDSRNLYLAREGLIMANSKAAADVSASDMAKRHNLEQIKTQVLKNLNRFVSRNRLSIHNLPLNYDNEKLKQMAIQHTGFKPHECRVMRENKISPEHPKGKSKGFGFLSFNTHKEALNALRKLNNNPNIFGKQHRPIVAFSIEDRAVHNIKEKRMQKSKISNPTYQGKIEKRNLNLDKKLSKLSNKQQNDDKDKLKKHIKQLEKSRTAKSQKINIEKPMEEIANFVGTESKPGSSIQMRSNKKIADQANEHLKRVKANKRKVKARKIRQIHLAERKAVDRPKQGRKKEEHDDLAHLVKKYKHMIDNKVNKKVLSSHEPSRTKWYTE